MISLCLVYIDRQDVLFPNSYESKTPSTPSNKRLATEVAIQVAEAVGGQKKGRKVDNRPLCSFCSKPRFFLLMLVG